MSQKKTICLDFDGVLHAYTKGWHDGSVYDPPMPGALESVQRLSERFKLVVQTSRDNLEEVRAWLERHGFPLMDVTNRKPPAVLYIDDRAFRFESWAQVMSDHTILLDHNDPPESSR